MRLSYPRSFLSLLVLGLVVGLIPLMIWLCLLYQRGGMQAVSELLLTISVKPLLPVTVSTELETRVMVLRRSVLLAALVVNRISSCMSASLVIPNIGLLPSAMLTR